MSDYQKNIVRKPKVSKTDQEIRDFVEKCRDVPREMNLPSVGRGYLEAFAKGAASRETSDKVSDSMRAAKLANQGQAEDPARVRPTDGLDQASVQEVDRGARANQGSGGMKFDSGKEPLSLLSRVWLLGVASVMGFGAKKYAAHNWRNGLERSRLISAAIRHILAYNEGEDVDTETGLSHLDHASCCLMFARELHETRPDLDDRYKGKKI